MDLPLVRPFLSLETILTDAPEVRELAVHFRYGYLRIRRVLTQDPVTRVKFRLLLLTFCPNPLELSSEPSDLTLVLLQGTQALLGLKTGNDTGPYAREAPRHRAEPSRAVHVPSVDS